MPIVNESDGWIVTDIQKIRAKKPVTLPIILLGIAAALVLVVIGIFVFQDNISRFVINPRTPFQTSTRPPAPDYDRQESWFLHPEAGPSKGAALSSESNQQATAPKQADIFYVHNTTHISRHSWNAAIDNVDADNLTTTLAIPNELGPFFNSGDVYAPRYRQATLFARFTHKYDSRAAYELAYKDIRAAFQTYLATSDPERPLFLIGYGQGGLHIAGVLKDFFTEPDTKEGRRLKDRLVAAYIIDHGIRKTDMDTLAICDGPTRTGCLVSFTALAPSYEKQRTAMRARALVWQNDMTLLSITDPELVCVNPLNWRTGSILVSKDKHHGAASATGLLLTQEPPLIRKAISAQCSDGILTVSQPEKPFLQRKKGFGREWRNQPFNLFYADLQNDARRRLLIHTPILAERVRQLDPIEGAVDLGDSPIKKVPN